MLDTVVAVPIPKNKITCNLHSIAMVNHGIVSWYLQMCSPRDLRHWLPIASLILVGSDRNYTYSHVVFLSALCHSSTCS